MNQVALIGRIANDLELRTSSAGKPFCGFRVAVSEYRTGSDERTTFIPCIAWDKNAENMTKFLKKGSLVSVVGRLSVRAREVDGRKLSEMNVNVDRVEFLSSNRSTDRADEMYGNAPTDFAPAKAEDKGRNDEPAFSDDDSIL